jgi:hypothetical protein
MNQQALDSAVQIKSDLWAVNNLLCNDELNHLLLAIKKQTDWSKIDEQKNLNRQHVPWETDGICDWLWCKLSALDFSRFELKFTTVMIWKDQAGYCIDNHADNDRVQGAMQIYLSEDHVDLGTWFEDSVEIEFKQNTGYIMHNKNKLLHGMKKAVPENYERLSFYALFDQL